MDEFIQTILSLVRTIEEQERLRANIDALSESLYKSFPNVFNEVLRTKFSARIGELFRVFFEKPSYMRNPGLIKVELEAIQTAVSAMRPLRLEIAFEPNEVFIERIATWVTAHIANDIVLDIVRDQMVGGGARIIFRGRYKENTLVDMVEDVFARKRDMVMKELQ